MKSDIELMLMAKAGWTVAYEEIVRRYQRKIINFVTMRLYRQDRDLAEDLAQEVFIKLYTSLPNYEPQGNFESYLYSIARNHLTDYYRRVNARPKPYSLDSGNSGAEDESATGLLGQLSAPTAAPDANLEREEMMDGLRQAIADLPEDLHIVFTLHKIEGKRYEEIATALGIPLGTVKSRMNAAFIRMTQSMRKSNPTLSDSIQPDGEGQPRRSTRRLRPPSSVTRATGKLKPPSSTRSEKTESADADASAHAAPTAGGNGEFDGTTESESESSAGSSDSLRAKSSSPSRRISAGRRRPKSQS